MLNVSEKRVENAGRRPEVFDYHDYREFLRDFLEFATSHEPRRSLRKISEECEFSAGYLPLILSGQRNLTSKSQKTLSKALGLSSQESTYLKYLCVLADSNNPEEWQWAMRKLQKTSTYPTRHAKELEVYQYLSQWYLVAIREMTNLEGFEANPEWIRARLRNSPPTRELADALRFLVEKGLITYDQNGKVAPPQKELECKGGVFRLALGSFHRQILALAAKAVDELPAGERVVIGHTVALNKDDFEKISEILESARKRVIEIGEKRDGGDTVYQVMLTAFPLTQRPKTGGE